jgi:hypothetical protein
MRSNPLQDVIARELLEQIETEMAAALHVGGCSVSPGAQVGEASAVASGQVIAAIRPYLLRAIEAAYEHGFYDGVARATQDGEEAFAFDDDVPASASN